MALMSLRGVCPVVLLVDNDVPAQREQGTAFESLGKNFDQAHLFPNPSTFPWRSQGPGTLCEVFEKPRHLMASRLGTMGVSKNQKAQYRP